jgi:hypothetical protein
MKYSHCTRWTVKLYCRVCLFFFFVLKIFSKNLKFYFIFFLQFVFVFSDYFYVLMLKIIF